MDDIEETQKQVLEAYLTGQRSFLLAMAMLFKADKEKFPNTNIPEMFERAWTEAWDCNDRIAKLYEVEPKSGEDLTEDATNQCILNDEMSKGDIENLANL